ncbi:MAG: DNA/RNA non-specific endonuclease [Methyloprofundus sp.]|nr:DNA/RNA non-specific endonuclease [Methyloprofundus sp.]
MKLVVFVALSLFTSSIFSASPTISDVEDLLNFIDKLSKPAAEQKVSPRTPYPKYQRTEVTKQKGNLLKLDYEGFTVWLDCEKRGAVKFQYTAQRDSGSFKRSKKFYIDRDVPKQCQQTSYKGYGHKYDRGHLVPANHLDHSKAAIKQSNFMTNILPQAANMNRGAWLMTEEITECYRDIDELLIIGGVIWGDNPDDDYFVKSHGVKTPDAFWKVIIRGVGSNQRAIAWIVPNSQDAKRKMLDNYQVSVSEIERVTGETMPVADYVKYDKGNPWVLPRGCDKG